MRTPQRAAMWPVWPSKPGSVRATDSLASGAVTMARARPSRQRSVAASTQESAWAPAQAVTLPGSTSPGTSPGGAHTATLPAAA